MEGQATVRWAGHLSTNSPKMDGVHLYQVVGNGRMEGWWGGGTVAHVWARGGHNEGNKPMN